MKKRILSGIRATGRLHLGNYLGMVKGMLQQQERGEYEILFMVADVHAITTPYAVDELEKNRREVVIDYLAAGLDPEKSTVFLQAEVGEHAELAFYFSSEMSIARMQHLPTFKEKVKQYPDQATMALLNYPILMAADILAYKSDLVPTGVDQEPHLEVAREVARKMNDQYGMDFPEPVRFATSGEYVPSLTGEGKMSKSVEGSYISLTDDLEIIKKKLAKTPTDSGKGEVRRETKDEKQEVRYFSDGVESVGVKALMEMVELFGDASKRRTYENLYESGGLRYGDMKLELAEAIYAQLEPIQHRRKELEANPDYVDRVMAAGTQKAKGLAQATVDEVKQKMGLGSPAQQPLKLGDRKPVIEYDDFVKLDMRMAKIVRAEEVNGADKLLKITLDVGSLGERTVAAGVKEWYIPEDLVGKTVVYLANLKPRLLRGIQSQGMVVAAGTKEAVLLHPDRDIEPGEIVR